MTRHWTCAAVLSIICGAAEAATVRGTVKVSGAAEAERTVVYVHGVPAGAVPDPKLARMSQKGARFSPAFLPVVKGTTVDMSNDDWVSHSVFSKSEPKPFDLGLYAKGEKRSVTFDKSGPIEVFCAIHPRMNAVVLVLDNPFFTKPSAEGAFSLGEVPAGTYEVRLYRMGTQLSARKVTVPAAGEIDIAF
jgi:plastocyanin